MTEQDMHREIAEKHLAEFGRRLAEGGCDLDALLLAFLNVAGDRAVERYGAEVAVVLVLDLARRLNEKPAAESFVACKATIN